MSKSRYSKTKAAGMAIGITRIGKQYGQAQNNLVPTQNRQMRRMQKNER